jgi:hypothetical protein
MRIFLALIIGGVIGFFLYAFFTPSKSDSTVVAARQAETAARENSAPREDATRNNFDAQSIKEDLERSGQVIREKAREAGAAFNDATANARITATIKTKLLKEPGLAALAIDVDTTEGVVTLSGQVGNAEEISTAMRLAMETEGVYRVVSTLQVKPAAP